MSNPLNFVQNFTEGSLELYGELSDMLAGYQDKMADEDVALLNEISEELTNSLNRVRSNGERASPLWSECADSASWVGRWSRRT